MVNQPKLHKSFTLIGNVVQEAPLFSLTWPLLIPSARLAFRGNPQEIFTTIDLPNHYLHPEVLYEVSYVSISSNTHLTGS
jgi:hypothetical protein